MHRFQIVKIKLNPLVNIIKTIHTCHEAKRSTSALHQKQNASILFIKKTIYSYLSRGKTFNKRTLPKPNALIHRYYLAVHRFKIVKSNSTLSEHDYSLILPFRFKKQTHIPQSQSYTLDSGKNLNEITLPYGHTFQRLPRITKKALVAFYHE